MTALNPGTSKPGGMAMDMIEGVCAEAAGTSPKSRPLIDTAKLDRSGRTEIVLSKASCNRLTCATSLLLK